MPRGHCTFWCVCVVAARVDDASSVRTLDFLRTTGKEKGDEIREESKRRRLQMEKKAAAAAESTLMQQRPREEEQG